MIVSLTYTNFKALWAQSNDHVGFYECCSGGIYIIYQSDYGNGIIYKNIPQGSDITDFEQNLKNSFMEACEVKE